MTVDQLLDAYYEYAIEGPALIPFIDAILADQVAGPVDDGTLLEFLDRIERIILSNIEDRYDEGPGIEVDRDSVREEAQSEVDQARQRVFIHRKDRP